MSLVKPLAGKSVLVIEDEYFLAHDARSALQNAGAKVFGPFAKATLALEHARQTIVDCALVDVNLGRGPDFRLAEQLIELGGQVVFVTGYDHSVVPRHLSHLPWLPKPVRTETLIAAVSDAVNGPPTA